MRRQRVRRTGEAGAMPVHSIQTPDNFGLFDPRTQLQAELAPVQRFALHRFALNVSRFNVSCSKMRRNYPPETLTGWPVCEFKRAWADFDVSKQSRHAQATPRRIVSEVPTL
jgi:hypothetical protein